MFCADCGAKMYIHRHRTARYRKDIYTKGRWIAPEDDYNCSNYNLSKQKYRQQCSSHRIRSKAVIRKLDTLVADFPDTYKLAEQNQVSKTYSFPKSYVSCRKPRAVSTEQRERAKQMMIAKNRTKGIKQN